MSEQPFDPLTEGYEIRRWETFCARPANQGGMMSDLWTITRKGAGTSDATHVEVLRDDAGNWFVRERQNDPWVDLNEPHDVEVYEALRTLGLA